MEEEPKKKRGGRKKMPTVSEMITEKPEEKAAAPRKSGAGAPRLYKRLDVTQRLEDLGIDPVAELVKIFLTTADEKLKVNIMQDLLGYAAPKQKAETVTHKVEGDGMADLLAIVNANGRPKPPGQ